MAALLVVAVGAGLYWRWRAHKAPALTDKDTIVLADFDNKTGDPVFDDTLKQGLAIQLEQSPFLALIPQGKVNQTLKMMGHSPDDHVTPEVAREVCQRTNSKATLSGSIAELGSLYVIGLKAVNCDTGDVLAEEQKQVAGKETVLKALDAAAISLRSKLGESLTSVQSIRHPVGGSNHAIAGGTESLQSGKKNGFCEKATTSACPSTSERWNSTRISPAPTPPLRGSTVTVPKLGLRRRMRARRTSYGRR